jgi:hypothetical protein
MQVTGKKEAAASVYVGFLYDLVFGTKGGSKMFLQTIYRLT